MDEDWKRSFTVTYKTMVDDLNNQEAVCVCLTKGLLSMEEKAVVDIQGTTYQKNDKLLTLLYKKFCCDPLLFTSFIEVLKHCQNSEHILKKLLEVEITFDTVHELAIKNMRIFYRRTFHYAVLKVNHLSTDSLIPALVSAGVLDMDTKEVIKNESTHKAKDLITHIYEQGFLAYTKFVAVLLELGNSAGSFVGQVLSDYELWSTYPPQDCSNSCPCKYVFYNRMLEYVCMCKCKCKLEMYIGMCF